MMRASVCVCLECFAGGRVHLFSSEVARGETARERAGG